MDSSVTEPDAELNELSRKVLDAAYEIHSTLGPGFSEAIYEEALAVELGLRGLEFERQVPVRVLYKGFRVGEGRIDLIEGGRLVVELKAVETLAPVHIAQTVSYLRASDCALGLLITFNVRQLKLGVRRVVLSR